MLVSLQHVQFSRIASNIARKLQRVDAALRKRETSSDHDISQKIRHGWVAMLLKATPNV